MAAEKSYVPQGPSSMANFNQGVQALQGIFGTAGSSTQSGGKGDVSKLTPVIEEMMKSITPDGMAELFSAIFAKGTEEGLPDILGKANTAGVRPQTSTTSQLLTNDLLARLTRESQLALSGQQQATGQLAVNYADLQRSPIEVTNHGGGLFDFS